MASLSTQAKESGNAPVPSGFNHISVPVKDVGQSIRFFQKALGADLIFEQDGFGEVRCGGLVIGFSKQDSGWTGYDAEFPHYGLEIAAEDMWPLKERLETNGVPTHPVWTRNGSTGLMYFRDPSGNLFELYCPKVRDEDASKMVRKGDSGFMPPLAELNHSWQG